MLMIKRGKKQSELKLAGLYVVAVILATQFVYLICMYSTVMELGANKDGYYNSEMLIAQTKKFS